MARRLLEPTAHVLAAAIFLVLFFRILPLTQFDAIPGDQGDARGSIATLEHWWAFYQGKGSWRSPPFFYPTRGVLGYNESLFLFTPFYAALRTLQIDMFAAFQGTLLALGMLGYAGCLWLLRGSLGLNPVVAMVGSAVYMFSNAQLLSLNHPQLMATAFLPYLALLTLAYVRRLADPPRSRQLIGVAICLMIGVLAFSNFYIVWFFLFFLMIAVVVVAIMVLVSHGKAAAGAAARWFGKNASHLVLMAVVTAVALVPFIMNYMPVHREFGGREFGEVAEMLPTAADYLNVSYDNLMWGWLLKKALPWLNERPKFSELHYALTPLLMLTFLVGTTNAATRLTGSFGNYKADAQEQDHLVVVLGISVLICLVLMVRVGALWSPWSLVYDLVPGASAIRSVFRFQLALALPVVIVVGILISRLIAFGRPQLLRLVGCALLVVLLIEQMNYHTPSFSKREQRERMAAIVPQPAACRSFYLLPDRGRRVDWIWQQIDAMLIALHLGIPTVHGYSGWTPAGWDLRDPFSSAYPASVADWIVETNCRQIPSAGSCRAPGSGS